MGKRLLRLKIKDINQQFLEKEVDLVLNSNEVFHGLINKIDDHQIILKTQHAHILHFEKKTIAEIIISE